MRQQRQRPPLVRSGRWKESAQAKNWVGLAVAQALGLDVTDNGDKAKIKAALKMYIKHATLVVVERYDEERRENKNFVEVPEKL